MEFESDISERLWLATTLCKMLKLEAQEHRQSICELEQKLASSEAERDGLRRSVYLKVHSDMLELKIAETDGILESKLDDMDKVTDQARGERNRYNLLVNRVERTLDRITDDMTPQEMREVLLRIREREAISG